MNDDPSDFLVDLRQRYDALVREQTQIAHERDDLARQLAAVPSASRDGAQRLEQLEQSVLSIRQARDLLLRRNHELIAELARAEDKVAELAFERDNAKGASDEALKEKDDLTAECERLRMTTFELERQLLEAEIQHASERTESMQVIAKLTTELNTTRDVAAEHSKPVEKSEISVLAEQLASSERTRDASLKAEAKARADKDRAISELESLRTEFTTVRTGLEKHIEALRARLAVYETAVAQSSAPLPAAAPGPSKSALKKPATPSNPAESVPATPVSKDDEAAALDAIAECLTSLAEHPDNTELLDALGNHLRTCSERAHAASHGALHRYAVACRELTRWMRSVPAKVPAVLPTFNEAIDLLRILATDKGAAIPDPAGALVYALDDDLDNCECVAFALEKMTLVTRYAVKPEVALTELQATPCSLIILDVSMPGMDGFEVCTRIRKVAHHEKTPILFVSGHTSIQGRIDRLDPAEATRIKFIAKPYNLAELSLKAVGMILSRNL